MKANRHLAMEGVVMHIRGKLLGFLLLLVVCCSAVNAEALRGGSAPWYPFSYEDDQGQPSGIAVDVVRQVMLKTGLQVEFVFYPANRLNLLLDEGRLDLNYADSPEWNSADAAERFIYSKPYLTIREHLYFLKEHPGRNQPLEHLRGLRIGVIRGYSYPQLATAMSSGRLTKVEASEDKALLELLLLGRVDGIAMVEDVFDNLISTRRLEPARFVQGAKLNDSPLVIKLQRGHEEELAKVDAALQELIESGEIKRIRQRHLTVHRSIASQN